LDAAQDVGGSQWKGSSESGRENFRFR